MDNRRIPGPGGSIPVRIYTPRDIPARPLPALVYYHGGGFVLGGLESYDAVCRALCNASGCLTIAVDYRLAPEHRFPAAVDDAEAALAWVAAHAEELAIDAHRIAVAGDSAGGTLAATLAQRPKRGDAEIAFQLLIYPMTAMASRSRAARWPVVGKLVDLATIDIVRRTYVPGGTDLGDSRLAPGDAVGLRDLPPAYIVTAGIDPLTESTVRYVARLRAAGNAVTHVHHPRMPHGFFNAFGVLKEAGTAIAAAGRAVAAGLGGTARSGSA
ncbi:MAG TPA: alpha/beta hydrolase [Alphaproteobacteria bacterium]|nr:alpha/beta hydrolase [Alphaproteobacteria bacterium]